MGIRSLVADDWKCHVGFWIVVSVRGPPTFGKGLN